MAMFRDRVDAGQRLAAALAKYANEADVLVLALPRGGVPVGYEVARRLGAPLDVLVVRKLGVPGHEELAMGAIASGGAQVIDRDIVAMIGVADDILEHVIERETRELERRERVFRGERGATPLDVEGKTVVLVDDGLATGSTMLAAVQGLRTRGPRRIVVAVPVGSPETCAAFRPHVDEIVCLATPQPFYAVGLWYDDFAQTSDDEVRELLDRAAREIPPRAPAPPVSTAASPR